MDVAWLALLPLAFVWPAAFGVYEPAGLLWLPVMLISSAALSYAAAYGNTGRGRFLPLVHPALALLAQGAVFPFYCIWAARVHSEELFAAIAGVLLNLFGVRTVSEGGVLYIDAFLRTVELSSSWEKLGAVWFILYTAGGAVTLLMKKARIRHYLVLISVTLAYAVLRYVFLIMLYCTYSLHGIFWQRTLAFATFIPYALILAFALGGLRAYAPAISLKREYDAAGKRNATVTVTLAFLLVFSGVGFFGFRDAGTEKPGRVMVDEYHSDWEWTTDAYDEQWFGERSGYNYYCFFNYLDRFYETTRNMNAIDAETLEGVDVFIMKTPTKPFTAAEIGHMTAFVYGGGGLYLIGDHTNVFGTGTNLNQISQAFGLTFNYDCTYELTHGSLSEYAAPRLMPHPVVTGLPRFLFATSNTLGAKWQAEEVILGYGLKNLQADYSQKNFFPADTNAPTLEFGLFLQSAGVRYGKGRVLAFTDSTVFSNFWMFMPGKPELLLGSVEWLNRENNLTGAAPREAAAVFLAVMLALNACWGRVNRKRFPAALFITSGLAAFVISAGLFHAVAARGARLPEPIKPMQSIRFEREYSRFKLPDSLDGFLADTAEQLNTFYVWTQRLDYFPGVDASLKDALRNGSMAVMAKPERDIKDASGVLDAINAGARLLILDNTVGGGHSNSLLKRAGMELIAAQTAQYADYGEITDIPLTADASAVVGGEALMKDREGNTVLAVQRLGDGLIAVFSDPDLFYNAELGDVSANLTDKTGILTELEFKLIRALLE